jgi:hypothetical protein
VTGFSAAVRTTIRQRAEGWCEVCGVRTIAGQAHHRRPRGAGGSRREDTNTPSNALWLCSGFESRRADAGCHNKIESHRADAFEKGWLVRQGVDPSSVPVLYRGQFVYLGDDGSITPTTQNGVAS